LFIGSHTRAQPIRAHYDRLAIWPARAALPPVCGRSGHRPGRVARGSCANRCHPDHDWRLDSVQRASSHPDSACSPNQRRDNGRRTLFATQQNSARRCTGLGRCFKDHQSAFLLSQRYRLSGRSSASIACGQVIRAHRAALLGRGAHRVYRCGIGTSARTANITCKQSLSTSASRRRVSTANRPNSPE